ncbi:hypothetical protein NUM3379_26450 [Kineococcus sp. NUM-3379]
MRRGRPGTAVCPRRPRPRRPDVSRAPRRGVFSLPKGSLRQRLSVFPRCAARNRTEVAKGLPALSFPANPRRRLCRRRVADGSRPLNRVTPLTSALSAADGPKSIRRLLHALLKVADAVTFRWHPARPLTGTSRPAPGGAES